MKYTLLEITQDILSNLSSDEVNSISDSTEALQVATIIKQKYYDIISRGNLPEHNQVFQLNASLDSTKPTLMSIPDGIGRIEYIKYYDTNPLDGDSFSTSTHGVNTDIINNASNAGVPIPGYRYIDMLPIEEFLSMINKFNPSDDTTQTYTFSDTSNGYPGNFTFLCKNDRTPQYCCVLSNHYVIFDSFDNTQDSTLQGSKTMCFGQVVPTFQMVDTFIPDLDVQQFPLLLQEAKNLAYFELKQQPHQLATQEIKRQWSTVQKNKSINNRPKAFDQLPNFGRRTGRYYGTRRFDEPQWQ